MGYVGEAGEAEQQITRPHPGLAGSSREAQLRLWRAEATLRELTVPRGLMVSAERAFPSDILSFATYRGTRAYSRLPDLSCYSSTVSLWRIWTEQAGRNSLQRMILPCSMLLQTVSCHSCHSREIWMVSKTACFVG